jgi:hypothetical protein
VCGIAGIVSFGGGDLLTTDQLGAMCDPLYHRGPNEEGKDIQKGVSMKIAPFAPSSMVNFTTSVSFATNYRAMDTGFAPKQTAKSLCTSGKNMALISSLI